MSAVIQAMKWLFLGLLAALLVLLGTLVWVLRSEGGSRWVLQRVPGLTLENFQGRLGGAWQARQLEWQQPGLRVRVQQPALDWSPRCLWRWTLCVDRLQAQKIEVEAASSEKKSTSGPIKLPDIRLPVRVLLGKVEVGQFVLNGVEQASDLQLQARLLQDGLHVDGLQVRRQDIRLSLLGQAQLGENWPLQLSGQLVLPSQQGKDWYTELRLDGDLAKELHLDVASHGYLEAALEAWARPLDERLPARLTLRSESFKALDSLPDTLRLQHLDLGASGSLAEGFKVQGRLTLPAEKQPVQLALNALLTAAGADLQRLQLSADPQHQVILHGKANWQKGLSAQLDLDWQDFPWQSLYPGIESQVVARRLQARVNYAGQNYDGQFSADLEGPAGPFSLASPVKGDLQNVELPALKLVAGPGRAQGRLQLGFADGIRWLTDLTLEQLDPGYWVAQLPGKLNGTIESNGSLKGKDVQGEARIDLNGRLREQPAGLQLAAKGQGMHWQVPSLNLHLGNNRISGQGALADNLKARLDLQLGNLGQLWPGLRGQAKGQVDVAGTLQKPQGQLALHGTSIGFQQNAVARLDLQAGVDGAQRGKVQLQAKGIQAGANAIGDLTLDGQGDLGRQALQLGLQGPLVQTALALDGTLAKGDWSGRLSRGEISAKGMNWRLRRPASLARRADGRLTTGAHCWDHGQASLCMDEQQVLPDTRLSAHLHDFPLDELGQWLPKDFGWQGKLNADVQLSLPKEGPTGVVKVDAGSGTLRMRSDAGWQNFPYRRLTLDSRLTPQRVNGELNFDGERLGRLQLSAGIDPRPADKPLQGRFNLDGLDLSLARPFVPMAEQIKGQLNGSGSLGGTLQAPLINGQLHLRDGLIAGAELPTRLEQLQLDAQISGRQARLQGGWRAGDQGRADLSGNLAWQGAPVVDVNLRGRQLPVNIKPYADLVVEPDLHLGLAGERLSLSGKVEVPSGAIHVQQMPASTVKVSEDTVVVGRNQPKEQSKPLQMAMNVDVLVGQKHLSLSAFGLDALLKGKLHVGDNLDTQGRLRLVDGRFKAYGQDLTLRKAQMEFSGPIDQPYLEVEAIRKIEEDEVTAGIRLTGSLADPDTQVFSDPEMSQDQALSYLLTGHSMDSSGDSQNMLARAALGLGLASASGLTSKVGQGLGVSDLQLDTEGSGDNTSVVASGKINDRLSVRYGMGVFESASTIGLRYKLTRRIYLEAVSGLASSLDAFYHRDF